MNVVWAVLLEDVIVVAATTALLTAIRRPGRARAFRSHRRVRAAIARYPNRAAAPVRGRGHVAAQQSAANGRAQAASC